MEDFFDDIIEAITEAISDLFNDIAESILDVILNRFYELIYSAISEFFGFMQDMGAAIFEYDWIKATISLFNLLGWSLFVVGIIVAVFDTAMQYQNGSNAIRNTVLNILKGFFACNLVSVVPIRLYQFCISLQITFATNLSSLLGGIFGTGIGDASNSVLENVFQIISPSFYMLCILIGFCYCTIKIFFQNLMRGGILLTQIAIGSLYMFNIPRGYIDGFKSWIKQVIAICLTAFLQTTLLYLGLMTMTDNALYGLGIMLAAKEVPRVCQQFGLETSFNMGQVINQAFTNVRIVNAVSRMGKK